ncbi:MAG: cob(I)yrinic acid a,c-diamide adenosyltransferase [Acidobacteriota bacterium]
MPRLTKIYTRLGDAGSTRLVTGREVAKESPRVEAYGTVDELSALIGAALATGLCERLNEVLPRVQNELFHLGSDLATPATDDPELKVPRIGARHVKALESLIDEINATLGSLENFILPGGSAGAAALHVARAVCRRAERRVIALGRVEKVGEQVIPYLNRLSDALFVMARYENRQRDVPEPLWDSRL